MAKERKGLREKKSFASRPQVFALEEPPILTQLHRKIQASDIGILRLVFYAVKSWNFLGILKRTGAQKVENEMV